MDRTYKMETNSLIGLSHIIDEYEEFCIDLRELVERNITMRYIIETLNKYVNGYRVFAEKRLKRFYLKYSNQLININNHISLSDFLFKNFNDMGNPSDNIKAFHSYLARNREDAYKTLDLLYTFNKLDINEVELAEGYDFTKHIYDVNREYFRNNRIFYLDGIKPIPAYTKDYIRYVSTSSNYEIAVQPVFDKYECVPTSIKVNSLTFDNSRLPSRIDKYLIFDDLVKEAAKVEEGSQAIRNSVDFNIGIMDMEKAAHAITRTTNEIGKFSNKKELIGALTKIRDGLDVLARLADEYDNEITSNNKDIDINVLSNERQACLIRRNNNK